MEKPVSQTFGLRYLILFTKATPLSKQVTISMLPHIPIAVEYTMENMGYIRFYLAPRPVEEEEEVAGPSPKVDSKAQEDAKPEMEVTEIGEEVKEKRQHSQSAAPISSRLLQKMGLWTILEGFLLLANALAILNEDRFLAPRGWSFSEFSAGRSNSFLVDAVLELMKLDLEHRNLEKFVKDRSSRFKN
ncbi:hypothetical protein V6N11_022006 [Hibiscus sabdariffa]|uniref:Proliferating cell nuclear antigen PCNA C-terminal domain-containing protein n=1 Tax=Hibiscus sabdariffa TaxID=183260 RepID=A0ABR2TIK7_9ROSI